MSYCDEDLTGVLDVIILGNRCWGLLRTLSLQVIYSTEQKKTDSAEQKDYIIVLCNIGRSY